MKLLEPKDLKIDYYPSHIKFKLHIKGYYIWKVWYTGLDEARFIILQKLKSNWETDLPGRKDF